MSEPERGTCKSCNAPVQWVRMVSGNLAIVDLEPVPDGNIVIEDGVGRVLKKNLFEQPAPEGPRYKDHHATCLDPTPFLKKGKKK